MQVSREEKTDVCPSAMGKRKTSTKGRVSFDPRDGELVCPSGGEGLVSDDISSVQRHHSFLFSK